MKRKDFVMKIGAAALILSMAINLNSCTDESEDMAINDDRRYDLHGEDDPKSNTLSFGLSYDPYDVLRNDGSRLLLKDKNVLLVNVDGITRAFTNVCAQCCCNDSLSDDNSQITCSCHGSRFSHKGEVVQGSAARNLTEISASTYDSMVEINLI